MHIPRSLEVKKATILRRWRDAILSPYPPSGAAFFARETDDFHNPVGATVRTASESLLDALFAADARQAAQEPLRALVELRAIQELSPSHALAFVPQLKTILSEELSADLPADGWEAITARIDALLLTAFDCYVSCREKVYELRTREARARVWTLLQQAERLSEPEAFRRAETDPREGRS